LPTHGSLTKAEKVRAQTPNIERTNSRGSLILKRNNQGKYLRCIVKNQESS
jgi:ribosomal protein S30